MTDQAPIRDPAAFLRMGYILALHDMGYPFRVIGERLGISGSRARDIGRRAETLRRATPLMRKTEARP